LYKEKIFVKIRPPIEAGCMYR